jgi:hypothetical protein
MDLTYEMDIEAIAQYFKLIEYTELERFCI